MRQVIVFKNQEIMNAFAEENKIPEGVGLDYFDENGTLSRIDEHDKGYPSFFCVDMFTHYCRAIFFAMSEGWRRLCVDDEPVYIAQISCEDLGFVLKKLKAENEGSYIAEPYRPRRIWEAPATIPINNNILIEIKKDSPKPAIDGLLGQGESLLISGAAGIGKSLLVNYMAYALANQKSLWGQYDIPQKLTSLIIQSEVDGFAQRDRLKKLLTGNPTFKSDRVFTLGSSCNFTDCRTIGWLNDEDFQQRVKDAIEEIDADVLFIDPLISFNPVDENNNTQMRKILDSLMDAVSETGVSVVVTHHVKKDGSKTRGASAIRDWAANAIELELDRLEGGESRIKVIHDKARNFEQVDPFYLTRTRNLSFELAESKATRREDERLQCVVDALKAAGGRIEGQRALQDLVCKTADLGERTARERIRDARDCELILEIDGGARNQKTYLFFDAK